MEKLGKVRTIVITAILISTGFLAIINFGFENVEAYELHYPIVIDGNSDFISSNGIKNGSGTSTDPYIIENWIIVPENDNGIEIKNTDKHFIIRDTWVHNARIHYHGIYLSNVKNGQIENTEVSDCYNSITVKGSSNIILKNNTVSHNSIYGFNIETSTDISINNNNVLNCAGVRTFYSNDINISNNLIKSNNWGGIHVDYSNDIEIYNNQILKNECGVELDFSTNITIINNMLESNGFFISGDSLNHYTTHKITKDNIINGKEFYFYKNENDLFIDGNDMSIGQMIIVNCHNISIKNAYINNTDVGIEMVYVNGAKIFHNTIIKSNEDGIDLSSSNNITIESNEISENNGDGIRCDSSFDILIEKNVISFNSRHAIASFSGKVIIKNNVLISNEQKGILIHGTGNSTITGNNISSNTFEGICLSFTSNITVSNNLISNNKYAGIEPFRSNKIIIKENEVINNGIGIRFFESTDSIITQNVIESNYNHGLFINNSENNKMYHNIIIQNSHQAYDTNGNENYWYDEIEGGNYWSDYTGLDNDGDGFGDVPHKFDINANDKFPLINPYIETPNAPILFDFEIGDSFINLTWDPNVNLDTYPIINFSIYRSTQSSQTEFYIDIGNQNYFNDTNVSNGITYFYTISAMNFIGEGARSNEINATPKASIYHYYPECSILSPLNGAMIGGEFKIFGTASYQNNTIEYVEIKISEAQWVKTNGTTSWSYTWDTNDIKYEKFVIQVRAYGNGNFSAVKTVNVIINNSGAIKPQPPSQENKDTDYSSIILFIIIITVIVIIAIFILSLLIIKRKFSRKRNYKNIPQNEHPQRHPIKHQKYGNRRQSRVIQDHSSDIDDVNIDWDNDEDLIKY